MPTLRGQSSVAHHNLRTIVQAVQAAGTLSRREVAQRTGLSTPTVTRHVNELVAVGALRLNAPANAGNAGPGRPAEELELDPGFGCVLGVDVGEHTIRAAVANFAGRAVAAIDRPTMGRKGRETSLDQLAGAMRDVLQEARLNLPEQGDRLRALVLGVPGMVRVVDGVVLDAPNLAGWTDLPLADALRERLQLADGIRIENDVNLAAVGESARGAAKGVGDFVFVSVRRGIGAGIFVDGRLLRGHGGMAGELGFMASTPGFDHRAAGGLGHLETTAGEQTLLERVQERDRGGWSLSPDELSLRDLCLATRDGDRTAGAIMDEALLSYGVAVANIASLLDPELVVVGGDVAILGDRATDRIRAVVHRLVPHAPKLRTSMLGEAATLQGALHQAHMQACQTVPGVLEPVGGGRA